MRITIKAEAAATINEIGRYVDSKNTPGSGKRFVSKFLKLIQVSLKSYNLHGLCKFPEFADKGWKCFFIKDWIIAYKVGKKQIEIKAIIHGTLLNY